MVRSPTASLTAEIAALRKGVRRVVIVLAGIPEKQATKVASRAAIKAMTKTARGSFQMTRDFETAYRLAAEIRAARAKKQEARRQPGRWFSDWGVAGRAIAARVDLARRLAVPLPKRYAIHCVQAVKNAAKATFRHGAAGGSSYAISFVDPGQPVDYDVFIDQNWDTYSKRCRYAAREDHHRITVQRDWYSLTKRLGGPIIDRCMILSARPVVVTQDGTGVFAATVAIQAAGFAVRTESRFLTYWGHGVSSLHKSYDRAIREKPPARILEIVRAEADARARERELADLDAEDLAALQDAFAA